MSRIYDASQLTIRRMEKAIANSFLTPRGASSITGGPPLNGMSQASVMNAVRTGQMTEYTRFVTSIGISAGCPCDALNASLYPFNPAIPGPVSGITFTVGSIVVSWSAPSSGVGPFTYTVTPFLDGVALNPVQTTDTRYRFVDLEEWKPYTFTVVATNDLGASPTVPSSTYFIMPPNSLSIAMSGSNAPANPDPSLTYILNDGLNHVINYSASANLGPTKTARFLYLWITSVAQAWNWITADSRVTGIHDNWNWDAKASTPLSNNDAMIWMSCIVDYVTPFFVPGTYQSIYNCPADVVARVKTAGQWDSWVSVWTSWAIGRQSDGSAAAISTQPTDSANWNQTVVIDGTTVNHIDQFPAPLQWTRLTVKGNRQNYLTYNWDSVTSTCLSEANEAEIQASVAPSTGAARNAEIDTVKEFAQYLNDRQKAIAEFWAGSNSTKMSPPAMCAWLWKEYIRSSIQPCATLIYSLLDLGIHLFEGSRVTWRLKKAFMESRPVQEIRRRYTGQTITSWNGVIDGAQWIPYQNANLITPPFADFPSGHSHFSKGFALTMNKWFGSTIIKNQTTYDGEPLFCPMFSKNESTVYGDFTCPAGGSTVQPGVAPSVAVPLSFYSWNDMADQAGMSRLYGGIHAMTAHQASQTTAVQVDGFINATWNIRSAPLFGALSADPTDPNPDPVNLLEL